MEFVIIAVLIISNGILAMSEIALVSLRKANLAADAKRGSKSAKRAIELAENPERFFSTVQIGITLIGILTGIYSGDAIAGKLGARLRELGIPASWAVFGGQAAVLLAATYLTLVFGELVPKRIGLAAPEKVAKLVSGAMTALSVATAPFVWILGKSSSAVLGLLGIKNVKSKVTEREIKSLIEEGESDGEVQAVERNIVERVFTLGDRCVESIMTPRNAMESIDISLSNAEISEIVEKTQHSVYPITRGGSLDDIIGTVKLESLFGKLGNPNFSVLSVVKPAHFFKEDTQVYSALEQMRELRLKNAIISNEFGVTLGMVTLNDIIDAVLGDMPEADEETDIVKRRDGTFLVDGQCPFHDFLIFFDIEDDGENAEYNTVAGLILSVLKHIPRAGEIAQWGGFEFEIADMDGARIDKVIVKRLENSEE